MQNSCRAKMTKNLQGHSRYENIYLTTASLFDSLHPYCCVFKAMAFVCSNNLVPSFFLFDLLSLFSRLLQEEDFHEMVRASEVMENQYSHLFDKVIVNDDVSAAFRELRMTLRTVETETHWVPVSWTHS